MERYKKMREVCGGNHNFLYILKVFIDSIHIVDPFSGETLIYSKKTIKEAGSAFRKSVNEQCMITCGRRKNNCRLKF